MASKTLAERFWAKVDRSGGPDACWPWTAYRDKHGYGRIGSGGRGGHTLQAHRVAYELENGPIPGGLNVLHDCPGGDLPACCNPRHLWLGTQADNLADMARKWRGTSGQLPYGVKANRARRTRYETHVGLEGGMRYLGTYDTIEEAHRVALRAKMEFYTLGNAP